MIHAVEAQNKLRLSVHLKGVNWDNLMNWCKSVWLGTLPECTLGASTGDDWAIIAAATNVADHGRALSWDTVMKQLKGLRYVAVKLDERWLE